MDKENLENIISKYIDNEASESELEELLVWLEDSKNEKVFIKNITLNHYLNKSFKKFDSVKAYQRSLNIYNESRKKKRVSTYFKYVAAASIVLLISLTIITSNQNTEVIDPIIVSNNIEVGTDKATLTLANGTDVALGKGETYINDNIKSNGEELVYENVNKPKSEIEYHYLTIPRGGQYFIKLHDGTRVWLNSESQLKFPTYFIEGETRKVELVYGEAYFDVSSSTKHKDSKFEVFNQAQEIEVLGTEFNIKAYRDEINVYTTLVEGEIVLNIKGRKQYLSPNQQSNFNRSTNVLSVEVVDVYNEVSWKDGIFSFDGKTLKEIMKVLSRWYNIDVTFLDKSAEEEKFKGALRKNKNLRDILLNIKNFGTIKDFEINEKTVIIK